MHILKHTVVAYVIGPSMTIVTTSSTIILRYPTEILETLNQITHCKVNIATRKVKNVTTLGKTQPTKYRTRITQ